MQPSCIRYHYYLRSRFSKGSTILGLLSLAFLVLSYMLLDNMDGKQAFRTGSCSPVGELLDHGCDSVNVALLNVMVACSIRSGPYFPLINFGIGCLAFYVPHWQEYFTHYLELGYFNGPTEVEVLSITIFAVTGIVGPQIWSNTIEVSGYSFTMIDIFVYAGYSMAFLTIIHTLYTGAELAVRKHKVNLFAAFSQLSPLVIATVAGSVWAYHSIDLYLARPFLFLNGMNLVLSYLVIHCIVQRICDLPYRYFYLPLIPLLLAAVNAVVGKHLNGGKDYFEQEKVLIGVFLFYFFLLVHFSLAVLSGLCDELKIKFWTIPYPNKATKKSQ